MKLATNQPTFIPDNPSASKFVQDLFMDEDCADVVFEVSGMGAKNQLKESKTSPAKFHAHKLILKNALHSLQNCAC